MNTPRTLPEVRFAISAHFRAVEAEIDTLHNELIAVSKERDELKAKLAELEKKEKK